MSPARLVRRLALVVCLVFLAVAVGGVVGSGMAEDPPDDTYQITQDGQCIEVEPIVNDSQTVEEFYDYRNPVTHESYAPDYQYSSYGTTEYQSDDTSILMLYEGSDGLGLVIVHDQVDGDTAGGAATFEIDGLPEEGEWVQFDAEYPDDHYGGPISNYDRDGATSTMNWTWSESRTDGAAFRGGLEDDFEITIDPYFNDEANLDVDQSSYQGDIDDWEVISAAGDSHTSTSLDSLNESVTIQPGGCPSLTVSSVTTSPNDPEPGEEIEVRATVTNDGSVADEFTVETTVDDEPIEDTALSLDPGESEKIIENTTVESADTYEIGVENTTTSLTVTDEETEQEEVGETEEVGEAVEDDGMPGFGIIAGSLAVLVVAVAAASGRSPG